MSMADDIEYYMGDDTQLGLPPPIEPKISTGKIPLLFLDIDGVLNTRPGSLDADKLERLRRIYRDSGCAIVLSSSWRNVPHQLRRFEQVLYGYGMRLTGRTPNMYTRVTDADRWEEINKWLNNHIGTYGNIVILDDLSDMGPYQQLLVRTESHVGLTDVIADQIINLLNS